MGENKMYAMLYDSSEFSVDNQIFIEKCKGIKNVLILVLSNKGKRFGAYISIAIREVEQIRFFTDPNAYLISLDNLTVHE